MRGWGEGRVTGAPCVGKTMQTNQETRMRALRTALALGLPWLSISLVACGAEPDAPGPVSVLSLSANPRPEPPPTGQDILAAVDLAWNAGARGQFLSYTWSSLEPSDGDFRLDDLGTGVR